MPVALMHPLPPPNLRPANRLPRYPGASRTTASDLWLRVVLGILVLGGVAASIPAATPTLASDHGSYFVREPFTFHFAGTPGNPRDRIGIYRTGNTPGPRFLPAAQRYLDDTATGVTGVREGSITFTNGLVLTADWTAYLLADGGYTVLASNLFRTVDPLGLMVRVDPRTIDPLEPFDVAFFNGRAEANDWLGLYPAGANPASTPPLAWRAAPGQRAATPGGIHGSVAFEDGLPAPGSYVAYWLADDGLAQLASESFQVRSLPEGQPRWLARSPAARATNQPPVLEFTATITNLTAHLALDSIRLELDGIAVVPSVTSSNGLVHIRYLAPELPAPASTHTWKFSALDDAIPPRTLAASSTVVIGAYRDLGPPAPIYFENFDQVPKGGLPAGWTARGHAVPVNPDVDFADLGSAAYSGWTTVDADRFLARFATYGDPSNPPAWGDDYRRVLATNRFNVRAGKVVDGPLARGRFLFGNSGFHNPSEPQVLELFTPDFDLTGWTDIHVGFNSLWEQNQDSLAALEYSIDRGASWLPVAYLLDDSSIARTESGGIDAVATFQTAWARVPRYSDAKGNEVGGTFGAFLAAPVSTALAPYIQSRVQDDPVDSKRCEYFRLPAADRQGRVRLRFLHAGNDSWYWGLDDFGIHGIRADLPQPPVLTVRRTPLDGLEIRFEGLLQSAETAGGPFQDVPEATSPWILSGSETARFYRSRR